MTKLYTIEIKSLIIYAYHGLHPEEQSLGQEFELDLQVSLPFPTAFNPMGAENYLSYVDLIQATKDTFLSRQCVLIEEAALLIIERVSLFEGVSKIHITIKKPHPPIPEQLDSVGISLNWEA